MQRFVGIIGALVVVVVGAWYFAMWKPLGHKVSAAEVTKAQTQTSVANLRAQVADFVVEERHAPAERAALRKLDAAIPGSPQLSSALRDLASAAAASGAALSTITPTAPATTPTGATGSGPTPLQLTLAATGSYRQLTGFLRDVESLPRLFVASSVTLGSNSASASGSGMSLSLNLDMFYSSAKG